MRKIIRNYLNILVIFDRKQDIKDVIVYFDLFFPERQGLTMERKPMYVNNGLPLTMEPGKSYTCLYRGAYFICEEKGQPLPAIKREAK